MDWHGLTWIDVDWHRLAWIDMDRHGWTWLDLEWHGLAWDDMSGCSGMHGDGVRWNAIESNGQTEDETEKEIERTDENIE